MWKRASLVAVVLLVAVGVWAGFREMRRDACFGGSGGPTAAAYEGLALAEAEARARREGEVVRVLGEDGDCNDRTDDRDTQRVSVYLEDGEVVRARRF
jgi:hypothetical protein